MCEALFHIISINIAKVRRFFFVFQGQIKQLKTYLKKIVISFIGLRILISTQKHLDHSTLNNEVKVMRSFILQAIKVESTDKVVF